MSVFFDLTKTGFKYKFVAPPSLTTEQLREVDDTFDKEVTKNDKVFNSKKFAAKTINIFSGNNVAMGVCETDYKKYIWSRGNQKFISGLQPLSVDAVFYDYEYIYLLQKSTQTQYTKGKVDTVGGTLDFKEGVTEETLDNYLKEHMLAEIEEEVSYEGDKITQADIEPFVACFNSHLNKVDILYKVKRAITGPKNWEAAKVEKVKINELEKWTKENKNSIPEVFQVKLDYICNKFV